jgi:class 3 adenylate cyclase/tetratricopeptide (TPR) repeat protein
VRFVATEPTFERRIVTVLFADLVGFTSLSEGLDPEDVATIQDAYFSTVREVVGRYGGQLEKFIGDAVVAVFGAPVARDDDAERAVRAGLALMSAVEHIAAKVGLHEGDLLLRVGVNTGEVVHAASGPDAGRVTGDTVNVAARLQTAAPPGQVLLGETTALAVAEAIALEDVGRLELKGKAERVHAFAAVGVLPKRSRDQAMGRMRAPILGRDQELATLAGALGRVRKGSPERWLVVAPPGVGKTRLLEEFAALASGDAVVWRARLRPDVVSPFDPVAQLVLGALGSIGVGEPSPEKAKGVLLKQLSDARVPSARGAVIAEEILRLVWPSPLEQGSREPTRERDVRFAAWLQGLDAMAAGSPTVWLVEDVHWAGGDVLAFLGHAGREASTAGLLVLCTARPSLLEWAPDWREDDAIEHSFILHLPSLSGVDAGDLVRALVGDALPDDLVARISERSDGNPLFIEELLRTWISVGTIAETPDGSWRLTSPAEDVPLPATVQAIYSAQLDDLPPAARQMARRASVAGRRFPVDALEPLGVKDAPEAIAHLRTRALITGPLPDLLSRDSYSYRHVLLRDAGYASLARAERARLHVRLARWLEEAAGEHAPEVAEVIGGHYAAAMESAPALAQEVGEGLGRDEAGRLAAIWFERAAEAALVVSAHAAARTLLRRALDLAPEDAVLDRARRWERLGDATAFAADMDEGARAIEEAIELFRSRFNDPKAPEEDRRTARSGYARSAASLGMVWCAQLRFEDAQRLANQAIEDIGEGKDLETARLLYLRAWATYQFFVGPTIRPDLERSLELARSFGDEQLELEVSNLLGTIREEEGELTADEAMSHYVRMEELATTLGNWPRAVRAKRMQVAHLVEDQADRGLQLLEEVDQLAQAHGLTEEIAWTDYARAEAELVSGDWDQAWKRGLSALGLAESNAYHRVAVRSWFTLCPIAAAQGRTDVLDRAQRWLQEHESILPPSPYGRFMRTAMDLHCARFGIVPGFTPEADALLESFEEWGTLPSWYSAVEAVVGGLLRAGEVEGARKILDRMARWNDFPLTSELGRSIESLLRARLLHAERTQPDRVAERARRALKGFRSSKALWWIAKAIRLLDRIGKASSAESAEAARIEESLGIALKG